MIILIYNILFWSSLVLVGKGIEQVAWYVVCNYDKFDAAVQKRIP